MTMLRQLPVERRTLLNRERLFASVYADRAAGHVPRALLLVGMAGSGKTVACHTYVDQLGLNQVNVELQPGREHGWKLLQQALEQANLPAARPAATLTATLEPLVVIVDRLELGLDEYGAPLPAVQEWLDLLLTTPKLHIVLVSRVFPSSHTLAQLTANSDVQLIGDQELAFTVAEAQDLWRQRQGQPLAPNAAQALLQWSGGLAAVVALACASGRSGEQGSPLQTSLADQIMYSLPHQLHELLVETAVLDTLTPATIKELTGNDDGQHLLRRLRQYGLLVVDEPATLHPLLREAALAQLQQQRERFLNVVRRAVGIIMAQGQYADAWQLATEAQLWELANSVVLEATPALRQQGASRTVIDWVERLPPSGRNSETMVTLARCQADVGDLDGAILTLSTLRAAEQDAIRRREVSIWLAMIKQARGEAVSADALIQPYLDDPALPLLLRTRVSRIHAQALALAGEGDAAWRYIEDSVVAAHGANEQRALAWAYQDQANIAGRLGRPGAAEQALRLAERCWRTVNSLPDLALPLNGRAMLLLGRRDYAGAQPLAQQARVYALAGGRLRDAAVASATCGDIAFAQGQNVVAAQHYQVSAEEAEQSGYFALRAYSLAMQAHVAWVQRQSERAAQLLPVMQQLAVESHEHKGWLASGIATAQMTMGMEPDAAPLEHALLEVGQELEDVRITLLITLAQTYWYGAQLNEALSSWARLEKMMTSRPTGSRLTPLAAALPALLDAATTAGAAPFARAARQLLGVKGERSSEQATVPDHILRLAVLGDTEQVWWQGRSVTLPGHALDLLIVLLMASTSVPEVDLLEQVWGGEYILSSALRKLVARLHAVIPGVIRRSGSNYMLALPRTTIDFDLSQFLQLEIAQTQSEQLLIWARTASAGCLVQHNAVWANELRRKVQRRLAAMWLELTRRPDLTSKDVTMDELFERAQAADPASDMVARAALQFALQTGDRPRAIRHYLHYQSAVDTELGVEPAADLHALYLQALEP